MISFAALLLCATAQQKPNLNGYTGFHLQQPKSSITMGAKKDIAMYRRSDGGLSFYAPALWFSSKKTMFNGKSVQDLVESEVAKSVQGSAQFNNMVQAAVNKAMAGNKPGNYVNPCSTKNGGCHSKRKCQNKMLGVVCTKCSSGYVNNGAAGCFVDKCKTNRGGCHSKRICSLDTQGRVKCAGCTGGFKNDGAMGCTDTNDWIPVMKIISTGTTFGFSSTYWTDGRTLNPTSAVTQAKDAKYAAFNQQRFDTIRMCVDRSVPDEKKM